MPQNLRLPIALATAALSVTLTPQSSHAPAFASSAIARASSCSSGGTDPSPCPSRGSHRSPVASSAAGRSTMTWSAGGSAPAAVPSVAAATTAATTAVASLAKSTVANPAPSPAAAPALVGATTLRVGVRTGAFDTAQATFKNIAATRQYYDQLPGRYRTLFAGQRVVISFLRSSAANTAAYVRSIPAGTPVELAYHHEPEGTHGDYAGTPAQAGARFVSEFNAQAAVIHANSKIPVVFIAGGYQYGNGRRGAAGNFIPPSADYYYMDSYQQNSALAPATKDQTVVNYRALLAKRGKPFAGFTEYARGTTSANPATRVAVMKADDLWLRSIGARLWVYWWYPSVQTGDNWQFRDPASIQEWNSILAE